MFRCLAHKFPACDVVSECLRVTVKGLGLQLGLLGLRFGFGFAFLGRRLVFGCGCGVGVGFGFGKVSRLTLTLTLADIGHNIFHSMKCTLSGHMNLQPLTLSILHVNPNPYVAVTVLPRIYICVTSLALPATRNVRRRASLRYKESGLPCIVSFCSSSII